jgi:phosphoglycolate phosphatase-like HAD superfamily hydrolase
MDNSYGTKGKRDSMTKLAVFDIDGTLTNTGKIDGECFVRVLKEEFDLSEIQEDWSAYHHTTNSGIIQQIFQEQFNRLPTSDELFRLKQRFVESLNKSYLDDSSHFTPIPGATTVLTRLREESGWDVALATGCWKLSALYKLKSTEIEVGNIPAAFADDGIAREEIFRLAVEKALDNYNQNEFDKIVSIGDAVWDVRTAANLKVAFLGIGAGKRAVQLRQMGAKQVIDDFTDYNRFLRSLDKAEIPAANKES